MAVPRLSRLRTAGSVAAAGVAQRHSRWLRGRQFPLTDGRQLARQLRPTSLIGMGAVERFTDEAIDDFSTLPSKTRHGRGGAARSVWQHPHDPTLPIGQQGKIGRTTEITLVVGANPDHGNLRFQYGEDSLSAGQDFHGACRRHGDHEGAPAFDTDRAENTVADHHSIGVAEGLSPKRQRFRLPVQDRSAFDLAAMAVELVCRSLGHCDSCRSKSKATNYPPPGFQKIRFLMKELKLFLATRSNTVLKRRTHIVQRPPNKPTSHAFYSSRWKINP